MLDILIVTIAKDSPPICFILQLLIKGLGQLTQVVIIQNYVGLTKFRSFVKKITLLRPNPCAMTLTHFLIIINQPYSSSFIPKEARKQVFFHNNHINTKIEGKKQKQKNKWYKINTAYDDMHDEWCLFACA